MSKEAKAARKFERLMNAAKENTGDASKSEVIGHIHYDHESQMQTFTPTPTSNDLEKATVSIEEACSKESRFYNALNGQDRIIYMTGAKFGHQHALSSLPEIIREVLRRASDGAKAYNTAPRAYSDAAVDKQSILDTKFDDLL